jgi:hypothetical protein
MSPEIARFPTRFPTRESYAKWLLAFLYADLGRLTPGQELEWRHGAIEFIDLVVGGVLFELEGDALNRADNLPTVAVLRTLQEKLKDGLAANRRGDLWVERQPTAALAFLDKGYVRKGSGRLWTRVYREGGFRELFVAAMWDVLVEAGSRIYDCPTCTKYFLKSRKQEYCSPLCSQKARWARFTANRPPRNYRREREQALKKRLGPRARVHPHKRRR